MDFDERARKIGKVFYEDSANAGHLLRQLAEEMRLAGRKSASLLKNSDAQGADCPCGSTPGNFYWCVVEVEGGHATLNLMVLPACRECWPEAQERVFSELLRVEL